MSDLSPDQLIEIAPGEHKRLGDCAGPEVEAAIRLIARNRIDLAWAKEQAAGGNPDGRVIARRFFVQTSEAERDLIAYWHMIKLVDDERLIKDD